MTLHRNIRLLAWFNFWAEFRPYAPIAILYFAQVSGSYALGMSVFSTAMLAQSVFEVPTGIISDRVGRKRTVIFGTLAGMGSLLGYALGGSYLVLLVGAIFEGMARSFFSGNNDALLYDTLAENGQQEHYREYLGKVSSSHQLALGISALLGSLLATVSYGLVMWLSVLPSLVTLAISLNFVEPRTLTHQSTNIYAHLHSAVQKIIQNPRLRIISLASILSFANGESAWLFRSAFIATLWPTWALGIPQMLANIEVAVGFYFAGRIIRRFGELRLLIAGTLSNEVINLFGLLVPTVASPILMSLSSIFYGINSTAINNLMQREFTDEQRATMGSLNSLTGSILFAVFSFLLGALADRFGVTMALVWAALFSIVPMSLYWLGLREARTIP